MTDLNDAIAACTEQDGCVLMSNATFDLLTTAALANDKKANRASGLWYGRWLKASMLNREMAAVLKELDDIRSGCSPDELGAITGKRVAAFVERYRAALEAAR